MMEGEEEVEGRRAAGDAAGRGRPSERDEKRVEVRAVGGGARRDRSRFGREAEGRRREVIRRRRGGEGWRKGEG